MAIPVGVEVLFLKDCGCQIGCEPGSWKASRCLRELCENRVDRCSDPLEQGSHECTCNIGGKWYWLPPQVIRRHPKGEWMDVLFYSIMITSGKRSHSIRAVQASKLMNCPGLAASQPRSVRGTAATTYRAVSKPKFCECSMAEI